MSPGEKRAATTPEDVCHSAAMRVHIGSDHAGFDLKNFVVRALTAEGHEVIDHGPKDYDAEDDYPVYCIPAAEAAVADPESLGVVIGGSGNGEQIAANKVTGARAVLAYDQDTAQLGRQHNNANVIGIGARMHTEEEALDLVKTFLATPFSGDPRHQRRIDLMSAYEKKGSLG
jgi:ribose 5-phosphate isomerase B